MRKYIEQMGINPERLRLEWISASEGKQFAQLADAMTERVMKLGPCSVKKVMETLA
jgi:F420-non-reducing hydrogenase iron-sulfur subunit